jgi:hypothetical protein
VDHTWILLRILGGPLGEDLETEDGEKIRPAGCVFLVEFLEVDDVTIELMPWAVVDFSAPEKWLDALRIVGIFEKSLCLTERCCSRFVVVEGEPRTKYDVALEALTLVGREPLRIVVRPDME